MKILIVDDEQSILRLVSFNLEREGYTVFTAENGKDGLAATENIKPDLLILDVMLPGMSGFELLAIIRAKGYKIPVIMLTAKNDEIDKVMGLEIGADDYITKPFSPREFVARVKAQLRRAESFAKGDIESDIITIGDIVIDKEKRKVSLKGHEVTLTPKEYSLLITLINKPGRIFSREQLLEMVWGFDFYGETRVVDVHISHLRDKLEEVPADPSNILTVRGIGYKFREADV
jgi:two-component system alkaline phosphatase synthesis response regulator PhoP